MGAYAEETKIKGKFGRVLSMDFDTGKCVFTVFPYYLLYPEQSKNGAVFCEGVVFPETEGMPVEVTGTFRGKTFFAQSIEVCSDRDDAVHFFRFASKNLSDAQVERLADAVLSSGKPLLDFFDRDRVLTALGRIKNRESLADEVMQVGLEFVRRRSVVESLSPYFSYGVIWSVVEGNFEPETDPYALVRYGATVEAADRYAREACGYSDYSLSRFKAFVNAAIVCAYKNGNSCIEFSDLVDAANRKLDDEKISIPPVLVAYCVYELGYMVHAAADKKAYVYSKKAWREETKSIERLKAFENTKIGEVDVDAVEKRIGMHYNDEQRFAFKALETSGVKVITGPPGTGKTTVARGLAEAFRHKKVRLAAVTGKAAEVLTEVCGCTATTIHSLLGIMYTGEATSTTDADLLIVDEVSMMGLEIFSYLVSSVKPSAVVVLMGDENQLPSVDYGNVLSDIIHSGLVEVYKLKNPMRSGDEITAAANSILRGETPRKDGEFFSVHECETEDEAMELIKEHWKNSQMLSPVKEGLLGCTELNRALQRFEKFSGRFVTYGGQKFYEGDRVLFTRNNYKLEYLNGDTGVVNCVYGNGLAVDKKGKTITLALGDMNDLTLGYALTVHKAQGSEYDNVLLVLPVPCSKKLLFTATTRARKKITVISVRGAFDRSIIQTYGDERTTLFVERANTCETFC